MPNLRPQGSQRQVRRQEEGSLRIHLLGLPHTETTKAWGFCAFTQKTRKLATMLDSLGYDVRLYAGESNEAKCTEHIPIVDRAWQTWHFNQYDWSRDTFNEFNPKVPFWREFNGRAIDAIRLRMEPGDILGMSMGHTFSPIAEALPDLVPVEVGVGYHGVWAPYRVLESFALRHFLAAKAPIDDERCFDAVIPNSFEVEDFPLGAGDGGYFLFIGRFIRRKGIEAAVEATRHLGMPLVMAGQGCVQDGQTFRGIDIEVSGDHLVHVGLVGPEERARLMGGAIATFTPSIYLEPFCGVHVESQLCGTPVITSNWGVFPETVVNGVNGYRCDVLQDYVTAARKCMAGMDRPATRDYAAARWSTDVVRHQYDDYLRRLATLRMAGWYQLSES
jgi:glycosyltransferase involved in cell wall biosynthesis